jgi:hypothetical protein
MCKQVHNRHNSLLSNILVRKCFEVDVHFENRVFDVAPIRTFEQCFLQFFIVFQDLKVILIRVSTKRDGGRKFDPVALKRTMRNAMLLNKVALLEKLIVKF